MKTFLVQLALVSACTANAQCKTEAVFQTWKQEYIASLKILKPAEREKVQFYPYNNKACITFSVQLTPDSSFHLMPTSSGKNKMQRVYALITGNIYGKPVTLQVIQSADLLQTTQYKQYLLLAFTDLSTGIETYTGGRYIDLLTTQLGTTLTIDFNTAYNPYCAYRKGFNCPLPPAQNDVAVELNAGEKVFR